MSKAIVTPITIIQMIAIEIAIKLSLTRRERTSLRVLIKTFLAKVAVERAQLNRVLTCFNYAQWSNSGFL